MSVNSSASLPLSAIKYFHNLWLGCFLFYPNSFIFTTFTITNILLLLPLCSLVLYHGLQRWRKLCSSSTAAVTTHSDSFTYHITAMEIINIIGTILYCCGIYENVFQVLEGGFCFSTFSWYGQTFFHVLTCVEHYLAVVHPITYLSLRKERWIRIRNIIFGCIWLLCFGWTSLTPFVTTLYLDFCLVMFSLTIISFCNFSVLCVLIRAGPRKQARVDQSKQRALYIIIVILGVLLLRCVSSVVWGVLYVFNENINECVLVICGVWINLPSSLVLPLLFLQRTGMLVCFRNNIK